MLRDNGLTIVLAALFGGAIVAMGLTGWVAHNADLADHHGTPLGLLGYLRSGGFASAVFENWESEFLQMGLYVLLTVWLRQRGSAESRKVEEDNDDSEEEDGREVEPGPTPGPVRRGGVWAGLYANSLSIALLSLFAISFAGHAYGSWQQEVEQAQREGLPVPSLSEHLVSAQFWFESFQNWQSEFLAVLSLVVLSIWLRQAHSPQSKPVRAPHAQTGAG